MSKPNFFCGIEALQALLQMDLNGFEPETALTVDLIEAPYLFIYTPEADAWELKVLSRGELYDHVSGSGIEKADLRVDRATKNGSGQTSDKMLSENMGAFFTACQQLSRYIRKEGLEPMYSGLDPEQAGIMLETGGSGLTARVVELAIVLWYMIFKDTRLRLFSQNFLRGAGRLSRDYAKIATPVMAAGLLWAVSVPLQSAVLGHLPGGVASDAIAANSVSSTFYQYLKVVVIAMASASGVMIGKAIGAGDMQRVRAEARSMSVIDVCVGIILGMILLAARRPLLSMYTLNDQALRLANQFMYVLCFVMIGMSYQMPVASGIIRGAGDTRFSLILNMVSTWGIVMPLTFLSAFVWKWPPAAVVCVIQSDQIFKGLPIFLRFRSYKWIKKLTRSA